MKLWDIIKDCGVVSFNGDRGTDITSITSDSRKVTAGCLFIAMSGTKIDGRSFIEQAVKAGAVAVMAEAPVEQPEGCENLAIVSDCRFAAAMAADCFYGHPSRELKLVGITGTNGKTTTVTLLYNMFKALGHKCGLLSTIANYVGDKRYEAINTTPGPMELNRLLAQMADEGCEFCFMEASSHAIVQQRTEGIHFTGAVFTNLTHDRLDCH
jgi:UDP-N-acetylmuramoyl-L-alanyl-D-glutamate--2,6-diaminopimelate ligase